MLPTATTQVAGFRYFNVYGPHEQHKGRMASVAFHHFNQLRSEGRVKLFGPYGGYAAGEQARDFVFVDDVVAVNLWFLAHPEASGIFNLGSGRAQPFNDVAAAVVNAARAERGEAPLSLAEIVAAGKIEYIDFPAALVGKYQCFTEADLGRLRGVGCDHAFADVAQRRRPLRRRAARLALIEGRRSTGRGRPSLAIHPSFGARLMLKRFVAALAALLAASAFAAVEANKATQAELEAISGIGPAISANIVAERKKGDFKDWNDLVQARPGRG